MSKLVALNLDPNEKTLRQFGFIALPAFGLLAMLAWYERGLFAHGLGELREPLAYALFAAALACLTFSLVHPRANRPLYVGLSLATYPIGQVLSYAVLGVLFFGVFGVVSLVLRVLRHDPMSRSYDPAATSYWRERTARTELSTYLRQG